jgi:type III restriction enzyme
MQLKEYQVEVLDQLSRYLRVLGKQRAQVEEYAEFQRARGREAVADDYCRKTWEALFADGALPLATDATGQLVIPPYVPRNDGLGRAVPNVCLKIPTGGGKTLLGAIAIERLSAEYFRRQTGLVLWIVPSDAIYQQTWKAFANREHPYRQVLERAAAGRLRLLEKNDSFTKADVGSQLCVMLLMLQASARKTKEQLKMFQDSGRFTSFFPEVDDADANKQLAAQIRNLDVAALTDEDFRPDWVTVKQSLGNVLRLVQPIVVIDEGHKAYSDIALETLAGFNPRFILELSATPNSGKDRVSNVAVDVGGQALKNEQMIKLPINIINLDRGDWKKALTAAKEKLDELQAAADGVLANDGRYIRPILVARVDRTGKEQRDKTDSHAEDIREYLIAKLGALPEQIKVKSAELDELEGIDLLSDLCPVRYIITKDALREGWDCPFAYVLAVLSKTTAATALTQMVGRVLRQPGARVTESAPLNECYVVTFDQEVQKAVESVRRGLQEEGMGDLGASVRAIGSGSAAAARRVVVRRRAGFEGLKIFLPRVLSRHYATGEWRVFDYDRDLLSRLDWSQFRVSKCETFLLDDRDRLQQTVTRVGLDHLHRRGDAPPLLTTDADFEAELDFPALVRLLLDVVPNPWQGARILNEALAGLHSRRETPERIYMNRLFLINAIKDDLNQQVTNAAEAEFRRMLAAGELHFQLEASGDPNLNWKLAETLEFDVTDIDHPLFRRNGEPLERSLFERVYEKEFTALEKNMAWSVDSEAAVKWWHRIAVHQDFHLQGWRRNRVYPDFLVCIEQTVNGRVRLTVLETKGMHLKGNDDTAYKTKLFALLTQHMESALPVGELNLRLGSEDFPRIRFELLLENNWQQKLRQSFTA